MKSRLRNFLKPYYRSLRKYFMAGKIRHEALNRYDASHEQIGVRRKIRLGKEGSRGSVFIGPWSYYGNCIFSGFHTNDVLRIGSFCSIADNSRFLLCQGNLFPGRVANYPVDLFFHRSAVEEHKNYTWIGNDVWMGADVTILPGVRIGNGAVIGAGSVVTHDVQDFEIVAGNPARRIRWRIEPEEVRQAVQSVGWWSWSDVEIRQRQEFFQLPAAEAVAMARQRGWIKAEGVPTSYLDEIGSFFNWKATSVDLNALARRFVFMENTALLLNEYKSLSYENLAAWAVILQSRRPRCIVEFGTQTGCSSLMLARLSRFLDIPLRIVTINIRDELLHRHEDVEYVIEDFSKNMAAVWERWNPDVIFQDAHSYALIHQQILEGQKHPQTLHVFHDVGFRMYQNPMSIPKEAAPTSATGSWERHVLGLFAPELLKISERAHDGVDFRAHIFDATADSQEYGLGVLEFK